jgi:ribosome-associated protein
METVNNLEIEQLLKNLESFIDEKMGSEITVLDVSGSTTLTSYILVTTATSQTHANSLSKHVVDFFLDNDYGKWLQTRKPSINNPWILIDAGDIVVHVFLQETREFYNIEKIYYHGNKIDSDS